MRRPAWIEPIAWTRIQAMDEAARQSARVVIQDAHHVGRDAGQAEADTHRQQAGAQGQDGQSRQARDSGQTRNEQQQGNRVTSRR